MPDNVAKWHHRCRILKLLIMHFFRSAAVPYIKSMSIGIDPINNTSLGRSTLKLLHDVILNHYACFLLEKNYTFLPAKLRFSRFLLFYLLR